MKMTNRILIYPLICMGAVLMLSNGCSKEKDPDPAPAPVTVTDVDGNVYHTVTIGAQTWMVENLKVTRYRNGNPLQCITVDAIWSSLTTGAYCTYNNSGENSGTYGLLYNWYAVDDIRNIAPMGWHVPTDIEWTNLEDNLIAKGYNYDGTTTDNKIAKALASTTGWFFSSAVGAVGNTDYPAKRNVTGFTALSCGTRLENGVFARLTWSGWYWCSSESNINEAMFWEMEFNYPVVQVSKMDKRSGNSVRCIKD